MVVAVVVAVAVVAVTVAMVVVVVLVAVAVAVVGRVGGWGRGRSPLALPGVWWPRWTKGRERHVRWGARKLAFSFGA